MAELESKPQEQQAPAQAPQQIRGNGNQPTQGAAEGRTVIARPCPKDCRKCSWQQQVCCASLLSFQAFEVMNSIIQRLDIQSQRIADMETRISAIQSTETELAAPCVTQGSLFPGEG